VLTFVYCKTVRQLTQVKTSQVTVFVLQDNMKMNNCVNYVGNPHLPRVISPAVWLTVENDILYFLLTMTHYCVDILRMHFKR
jgi:hypothetical protein